MKRNKKLMLTAIAAMGVVAMGVGGAGTFAWFSVQYETQSVNAGHTYSYAVVQNNTDLPELSLAEKTVDYKGKISASEIDDDVELLPVTTGATYDADQADINNSKISNSGDASAVFKSFVNYGTNLSPNYKEDTSTVATANCALHFTVTVSAATNPSSNKYTLKAGYKNDASVVTTQWVLAYKGASTYGILDMSSAKTTAVSAQTDIVQTTSAQTYEFLLWADGTGISSAIAAIKDLVVFSLVLQ